MDNLAHTLVGLALSRMHRLSRSPLATPALILGANLPDCDVVMRAIYGKAAYVEYHRGITHAVIGLLVQSLVLAFALHRVELRRYPDRAARHFLASDGPWLPAAVGLASHFVLDYAISYGIRPWLPFSGRWFYGDFVFVIDPWLWLLFGALAMGVARSRALDVFFALSGLFVCAVVLISPVHELGSGVRVGVPCGVAVLAWLYRNGRTPTVQRVATRVALALLGAYLGMIALARLEALATARAWVDGEIARGTPLRPTEGCALLPMPGDPLAWVWIVASESDWIRVPIEAFGKMGEPVATPRALPSIDLDEASRQSAGRAWREFARFPTELRLQRDGGLVLILSDARYWYTDFCSVEVVLPR